MIDLHDPANLDFLLEGVDQLYGLVKLSSNVKDLVAPRIREAISREDWAPLFDGPYTVSSGAWGLQDQDLVFAMQAEGRSEGLKYLLEAGLWLPGGDLDEGLEGPMVFVNARVLREADRRSTRVKPLQPSDEIHEGIEVDFKRGRRRFPDPPAGEPRFLARLPSAVRRAPVAHGPR